MLVRTKRTEVESAPAHIEDKQDSAVESPKTAEPKDDASADAEKADDESTDKRTTAGGSASEGEKTE